MKILNGIAVAGLTIVALTLGSTDSLGQDACNHGGKHVIQVRAGDDGAPQLKYRGGSAEEIHVCVGDQVQWVLTGSDREFFVDFFSDAGAPFDGATTRGSSGNAVSVVIGAEAESGDYDYGVKFAGGPDLDPRIVVD